MRRFRSILYVDFTTTPHMPSAIGEAQRLAAANDAKLTLYAVVPEPPRLQQMLRLGAKQQPIETLLADERRARLTAFSEALDCPAVEVDVAVGNPPLEIIRRVIVAGHDLVVLASDNSELSAATIRRLLRLCPSPVWVLRPNFDGARVLAAVDPGDDPGLNRLILDLAASQAMRYAGEFHVIHAWEPYGLSAFLGSEFMPTSPAILAELATDAEEAHRAAFEATLSDANIAQNAQLHLVDGSPHRAIIGLIELCRIDLLVMGSVGRGGLDRLLVGNTAEQLLKDVECSVLVVKPPGFISRVHRV